MPLIRAIGFRVKNIFYSLVIWVMAGGIVYNQRTPIISWLTDLVTGSPVEGITGWQLNEWFPMFILAPATAFIAFGFYSLRAWNHNRRAPIDLTENYLALNENVITLRAKLEIYNRNLTNFMASTNACLTEHGLEFKVDHDGASYVAHLSEAKRKGRAKEQEKMDKLIADNEALLRSRAKLIEENSAIGKAESTDGEVTE